MSHSLGKIKQKHGSRYKNGKKNGKDKPVTALKTVDDIAHKGRELFQSFAHHFPDNAAHLEKTGALLEPLSDKKRTDFVRRNREYGNMVYLDLTDRPITQIGYIRLSPIRYVLDPKTRSDLLRAAIERARKENKPKLVKQAIAFGLKYKINEALDDLTDEMNVHQHARLMQNKMAVTDTKKARKSDLVQKQFRHLDKKIENVSSKRTRKQLYTKIAHIHPSETMAERYATMARNIRVPKQKHSKPTRSVARRLEGSLNALGKKIEKMKDAAADAELLKKLQEKVAQIEKLKNPRDRSVLYGKLAQIHPDKEAAAAWHAQAVQAAVTMPGGTAKDSRLKELRDNAPDLVDRDEVHAIALKYMTYRGAAQDLVTMQRDTQGNQMRASIVHFEHGRADPENKATYVEFKDNVDTLKVGFAFTRLELTPPSLIKTTFVKKPD